MKRRTLLGLDAAVNLLLGGLLVTFPARLVILLGVPSSDTHFYPNVLGAVLVSIGLALLVEVGPQFGGRGGDLPIAFDRSCAARFLTASLKG